MRRGGSSGALNGGEPSRADYARSAANKDQFFNRRMQENANRREDLPPNQGGKYSGFGSTPAPRQSHSANDLDQLTNMIGQGFSQLGQVTSRMAGQAVNMANDPRTTAQLKDTAGAVASKGMEWGKQGFTGMKSLFNQAVSQVQAAASEHGVGGPARGRGANGFGGGYGSRGGGARGPTSPLRGGAAHNGFAGFGSQDDGLGGGPSAARGNGAGNGRGAARPQPSYVASQSKKTDDWAGWDADDDGKW